MNERPLKCPECRGLDIVAYEEPGFDNDGMPWPDWFCGDCGWAEFTTADQQRETVANLEAYEKDTGFRKPGQRPTIAPEYAATNKSPIRRQMP